MEMLTSVTEDDYLGQFIVFGLLLVGLWQSLASQILNLSQMVVV